VQQHRWAGRLRLSTVTVVIVATTLVALALRLFQFTRPGFLTGITEYDDGTDLGSAIRLVHGWVPYRDFIMVQPPGITVLMAPVALATKSASTVVTMATGRVLTALASAAAVPVAGLLTRHRGVLATVVTCGVLAVFPDSLVAARTVLLEPWLVLFCLLGMIAVFDRDRFASQSRLLWGGVAFGFAGAVKVWAILPVVVVLAMTARTPRRALTFAAGVAAGFLVPVLPFALTAPLTFYRSVIVAQLIRSDIARIPEGYRLQRILGLSHVPPLSTPVLTLIALITALIIVTAVVVAWRLTRQHPPMLDIFALATCPLVVIAFLWPADFYSHYAAFLTPFLALSIALPAGRLIDALGEVRPEVAPPVRSASQAQPGTVPAQPQGIPAQSLLTPARDDGSPRGRRAQTGGRRWPGLLGTVAQVVAVLTVAVLAVLQAGSERSLASAVPAADIAAVQRLVPPGACVLTDQVSYTIAINRFNSAVPGCSLMVDGVGSDYALSGGRNGLTGAGAVPAVQQLWLSAFEKAQYVWLTGQADRRIPWTPVLRGYFAAHFARIGDYSGEVYVRRT
jgi:hypothetical protein